ncbi:hypothetical protein ACFXQA_15035 [Microbacterium sp. P07]|uniref:hypothetical protein n=1 Tax=Microbacterium sp. P07 TaxID=3366952 RepID=UPI00374693A3
MSAADPFRVVHRAHRRRTFGLTVTGVVAASALAAVTWLVPAAVADQPALAPPAAITTQPVPAPEAPAPASVPEAPVAGAPAPETVTTPAAVLAAPPPADESTPGSAPVEAAPSPEPPPVVAAPVERVIAIDTTGYQAELDQCLWVRMNLTGASAPIVGAHNNCGGEIVLDLVPGDVVTLSGQNLDGRFVVVGSRDGRPGQNAREATQGLGASVILQTCYFDGPDVRLVALVRVV